MIRNDIHDATMVSLRKHYPKLILDDNIIVKSYHVNPTICGTTATICHNKINLELEVKDYIGSRVWLWYNGVAYYIKGSNEIPLGGVSTVEVSDINEMIGIWNSGIEKYNNMLTLIDKI